MYSDCRTTSTVHSIGSSTGAYSSNSSRSLVTASAHHHKKALGVNVKGLSSVSVGLTAPAVVASHGTAFGAAKAGGRPESSPANLSGTLPNIGATAHAVSSVVVTTRGTHESHNEKSCICTNSLPSSITVTSGTFPHGYGVSVATTGTSASGASVVHSPVLKSNEKTCTLVCITNIVSSRMTTTTAGHLLHVSTATCLAVNILTD